MNIPFHKLAFNQEEVDAVTNVLRSGWITMGQLTFEFEQKFADFLHAPHAVAVNSCTAALHLSLLDAGITAGDEVIIPANTFVASAEAVLYCGAKPVLADIDRDTHHISIDSLRQNLSSKTKALMPVHFSGHPCSMQELETYAHEHGLKVIEDAAHAFPSKYSGSYIGEDSEYACFSFYATKTLSTGEGGMIVTRDGKAAERLRRARLHSITKDAWNRYSATGSWIYDVDELGYKYNMNDITASLGLVQLSKAKHLLDLRKEIASRYHEAFKDSPFFLPYSETFDAESSWHLYPLKLKLEYLSISRDQFVEKLKEKGITCSVHFIPLYRFSAFAQEYSIADFPDSEWVFERTISLPIFPDLTEKEQSYIIECLFEVAKFYAK